MKKGIKVVIEDYAALLTYKGENYIYIFDYQSLSQEELVNLQLKITYEFYVNYKKDTDVNRSNSSNHLKIRGFYLVDSCHEAESIFEDLKKIFYGHLTTNQIVKIIVKSKYTWLKEYVWQKQKRAYYGGFQLNLDKEYFNPQEIPTA